MPVSVFVCVCVGGDLHDAESSPPVWCCLEVCGGKPAPHSFSLLLRGWYIEAGIEKLRPSRETAAP